MEYKVLLTTSGIGSRLGEITNFTNKSLVRVGDKPCISHILDNYPEEIEIVVTLGYYKDQVKDFLSLVYPKRKFTFVEVENFRGEGSCQGLSMLQAKEHLQCPFIFNSCDTIVESNIPEPHTNWVIGSSEESNDQYRTIDKQGNIFLSFKEKGEAPNSDKVLSYIGICGIKDYKDFWENLKEDSQSDCEPINAMAKSGCPFIVSQTESWLDIGSTTKLKIAKEKLKGEISVLDKPEENIYLINNEIVKFFHDHSIAHDRVSRSMKLQGITPRITGYAGGFYKYEKVEGRPLSKTINEEKMRSFLDWCSKDLWKSYKLYNGDFSKELFTKACHEFYFNKTLDRISKLDESTGISDKEEVINGRKCLPVSTILETLELSDGVACKFHGDCVTDNIIDEEGRFTIIDWRQSFGGLEVGDVYYDLAKLNHSMTFDIASSDNYTLEFNEKGVEVDIFRSDKLNRCREVLYDFLTENGYNIKKVELLTAIIWINMAPLHEGELKKFLFYFGKFYLNKYAS